MGTLGKISLPIWVEVEEKQTLQHSLSPVHAIQSILKILRTVYYLEQNTKCKLLVVAKISPLLFVQKRTFTLQYIHLQGTVVFTEDRTEHTELI